MPSLLKMTTPNLEISYQLELSDLVDGHYRYLTRDPRFQRKQKQNRTLGIVMIIAFGTAMVASKADPILIGTMMALFSAFFLVDLEVWAPKRLKKKLGKHLEIKGHKANQSVSYKLSTDGLIDEKNKVHLWNELSDFEVSPHFLAFSFKNGFTFLPRHAFTTTEQILAWIEHVENSAPHAQKIVLKD